MRRCALLYTWVAIGLALSLGVQPVIAVPFSTSLLGGQGFFDSIIVADGIGNVSVDPITGRMSLGGNEDVTIFMKIDVGEINTATLKTGGDILNQSVSQPPSVLANGWLAVGLGFVDPLNPSLGLINQTELINQVGGGDWPDLDFPPVDITAAVAGSSEIWIAMHAGQDSWRNYGVRVDGNAILTVEGDAAPPLPATQFEWNDASGLGNWATAGNWKPQEGVVLGSPADSPDHTAIFADGSFAVPISATTNVSTMAAVTVNRIEFDNNTASYVISGLGSVNLASTTDPSPVTPTMSVVGTHEFQADVNLQNDTTVDVASDSTLNFDRGLDLMGTTLTKTGDGTMAVNNNVLTSGGMVDCQVGTCSGTGTISGSLNNGGTVAPGNSPGILTVDGDYTQGGSGTLAIEIGGTVPGEEYDRLVVNGIATLDGTLDVTLIDGFELSGDLLFDVLDFDSVVGDFTTQNLAGLQWDVTDGTLCFGTCNGTSLTDYDNDGTWGLGDLNLVLFNWNEDGANLPPAWLNSRPGAGTLVGLPELNQVLFSWGQPGSVAAVPEPSTVILMFVAVVIPLLCGRKRND